MTSVAQRQLIERAHERAAHAEERAAEVLILYILYFVLYTFAHADERAAEVLILYTLYFCACRRASRRGAYILCFILLRMPTSEPPRCLYFMLYTFAHDDERAAEGLYQHLHLHTLYFSILYTSLCKVGAVITSASTTICIRRFPVPRSVSARRGGAAARVKYKV